MRALIDSLFDSELKQDIICIFILVGLTIITRLLLLMNAPFVYFFDSYFNLSKAMDFAYSGTIQYGVGLPFTLVLGTFLKVFGPILGTALLLLSYRIILL